MYACIQPQQFFEVGIIIRPIFIDEKNEDWRSNYLISKDLSVGVLTEHRYPVLKPPPFFFAIALVSFKDTERNKTVSSLRPRRLDDSFA